MCIEPPLVARSPAGSGGPAAGPVRGDPPGPRIGRVADPRWLTTIRLTAAIAMVHPPSNHLAGALPPGLAGTSAPCGSCVQPPREVAALATRVGGGFASGSCREGLTG